MEKEDQIIGMLEQVMDKLEEHGKILGEHGDKLDEHTKILGEHGKELKLQRTQLTEHGQILNALMTGQEHLKSEMDGMRVSNAKEFGNLKEKIDNVATNQDLLREDTWENKVDIRRIKNTLGMN